MSEQHTNAAGKPLEYTANDWFYLKSECKKRPEDAVPDPKCTRNKNAVKMLRKSTDKLGSASTKYDDAKMLYNRELLFTVNMLAGLALICYYVYMNRSVLPNIANAVNSSVKSASSKLTGAVSSVANNMSMGPPKPK